MINKPNISCVLNSQYFWDVDVTELDVDKAKRLIIERVFVLGHQLLWFGGGGRSTEKPELY
jgi:hypothetical protein